MSAFSASDVSIAAEIRLRQQSLETDFAQFRSTLSSQITQISAQYKLPLLIDVPALVASIQQGIDAARATITPLVIPVTFVPMGGGAVAMGAGGAMGAESMAADSMASAAPPGGMGGGMMGKLMGMHVAMMLGREDIKGISEGFNAMTLDREGMGASNDMDRMRKMLAASKARQSMWSAFSFGSLGLLPLVEHLPFGVDDIAAADQEVESDELSIRNREFADKSHARAVREDKEKDQKDYERRQRTDRAMESLDKYGETARRENEEAGLSGFAARRAKIEDEKSKALQGVVARRENLPGDGSPAALEADRKAEEATKEFNEKANKDLAQLEKEREEAIAASEARITQIRSKAAEENMRAQGRAYDAEVAALKNATDAKLAVIQGEIGKESDPDLKQKLKDLLTATTAEGVAATADQAARHKRMVENFSDETNVGELSGQGYGEAAREKAFGQNLASQKADWKSSGVSDAEINRRATALQGGEANRKGNIQRSLQLQQYESLARSSGNNDLGDYERLRESIVEQEKEFHGTLFEEQVRKTAAAKIREFETSHQGQPQFYSDVLASVHAMESGAFKVGSGVNSKADQDIKNLLGGKDIKSDIEDMLKKVLTGPNNQIVVIK